MTFSRSLQRRSCCGRLMSHTIPKHPVLDRTEHFRSTVDRLQLDCLDTVWMGQLTPLRFVCAKGHVLLKSPSQIRRSHQPCDECLQDQLTERLRVAAREAGVVWLNERWLGSRRHHQFCCSCGHRWQRLGTKAMISCACPLCAHRHAMSLRGLLGLRDHDKATELSAELRRVCAARGGVCLSVLHPQSTGVQRFRCEAGHEWESLPVTVLRGGWCRRCSSEPVQNLDAAQQQARYYGGQCLSQVYVDAQQDLQWNCGFGHTWFASLAKVNGGSWCRECRQTTRSSWKRLAKFRAQNKV